MFKLCDSGRLRDVQEVGRAKARTGSTHCPQAGPGDQGGRGARRRAGALHPGRAPCEDHGHGPARARTSVHYEDGEAEVKAHSCSGDDEDEFGSEEAWHQARTVCTLGHLLTPRPPLGGGPALAFSPWSPYLPFPCLFWVFPCFREEGPHSGWTAAPPCLLSRWLDP